MRIKKLSIFVLLMVSMAMLLSGCLIGKTYSLSGRVLDATGKGLAGVEIVASGRSTVKTTTDDDGWWTLERVKGTAKIQASKVDWVFEPEVKTVSDASDNINFEGLFPLIVEKIGMGSFTIYPEKRGYKLGEKVTITAVPANEGWSFSNWTGTYNGGEKAITFNVQSAVRLTGIYEQKAASLVFTDKNLEKAVRRAINKPVGIITKEDVEELNFLNASVTFIQSLKGIENLAGLTWLDLSVTGTTIIDNLASLTNLEYLNLGSNQIVNTSSLKNMPKLGELYLNNNKVVDLSSLSWLANKSLKKLDLSNNQIDKLSPIANLTTLTILNLANNKLVDITPLANMINLTELDLSNNLVDSINALNKMKLLQKLNLRKNKLTGISSIALLKEGGLKELNLSDNQITDIANLSDFTKLEKLNLEKNLVASITALTKLTNLREVNLSNNSITSIAPLAGLTNVEKLYLHKNKIEDIKPLLQMTNLKEVTLMENNLNLSTGYEDWQIIEQLRQKGILVRYDYYQNDAPRFTFPEYAENAYVPIKEGEPLNYIVTATDPNRDEITYSAEGDLAQYFNPATQVFAWTPDYDVVSGTEGSKEFSITFVATDGQATGRYSFKYVVYNNNRAPEYQPALVNITVEETALVNFTINAVDLDGDTVSYEFTLDPAIQQYFNSTTRVFNWQTGYLSSGVYTLTARATDNAKVVDPGVPGMEPDGPKTNEKTITITVTNKNRPPVLDLIGVKTVAEDAPLTFTITGSDEDPEDAGKLVYSVNSAFAKYFNPETREFSWTPSFTDAGTHTVTFTVTDAGGLTDTETVTITVTDTDRAPVWDLSVFQTSYSAYEYSEFTFYLKADDPDGDKPIYGATNLPTGANIDSATGRFVWTPVMSQKGNNVITFTVTTKLITVPIQVTIFVNDVEFDPILAPIGNRIVSEGQLVNFTLKVTELDEDTIFSSATGDFSEYFDPTTHTFSWTPSYDLCTKSNPSRTFTITFTVSDRLVGGRTDSETITITVNNGNRAPKFTFSTEPLGQDPSQPYVITVSENQLVDFTIIPTDEDGDAVTLSIRGTLKQGMLFVPKIDPSSNNGLFSWTPGWLDGKTQPYELDFVASDGVSTYTRKVSIMVINVDRPPVMKSVNNVTLSNQNSLTFTFNEYTPIKFNIIAEDPDTDDTIVYTALNLPTNAELKTLADLKIGEFSWTPNYTHTDRLVGYKDFNITFRATSNSFSVEVLVTIRINNLEFKPEFTSPTELSVTAKEGVKLRFQVAATDKDNDPLTYSLAFPTTAEGEPQYSQDIRDALTAAFNPSTRVFDWTPDYSIASLGGAQPFTLILDVSDGITETVRKYFTITVNNTDRLPTIAVSSDTLLVESTATSAKVTMLRDSGDQSFTIIAYDPDGESLSLSASGVPSTATFSKTGGAGGAEGSTVYGTFTWNPKIENVGQITIPIQATSSFVDVSVNVSYNIVLVVSGTRLSISDMKFSGTLPGSTTKIRPGENKAVTGAVNNTGTLPTGQFGIIWQVGNYKDGIWQALLQLNSGAEIGPIPFNEGVSFNFTLQSSELCPPDSKISWLAYGDYLLRAIADPLAENGGPAIYEIPFTLAPPLHEITLGVFPTESPVPGTAKITPSGTTFEEGVSVTIKAEPLMGWLFDRWSGLPVGVDATANPLTFDVQSSMTITANFIPITLPKPIAYISKKESEYGEIYIMNADGSMIRVTSNNLIEDNPRWSPNGRQLAYDVRDAAGTFRDIEVFNLDTLEAKNLTLNLLNQGGRTINKSPAWSPSGDAIAFSSNRPGIFEIYIVNPLDVDPAVNAIRVSNFNTGSLDNPMWVPDGNKIVCTSSTGALLMFKKVEGVWDNKYVDLTMNVASNCKNPVMSPDGSRFAFVANNGELFTFTFSWYQGDEYGAQTATSITNNLSSSGLSWSSDSTRITFISDNFGDKDISVVTLSTRSVQTYSIPGSTEASVQWTPPNSSGYSKLVFVSDKDGDNELYMMDSNGSSLVQVTYNEVDDSSPRWGK